MPHAVVMDAVFILTPLASLKTVVLQLKSLKLFLAWRLFALKISMGLSPRPFLGVQSVQGVGALELFVRHCSGLLGPTQGTELKVTKMQTTWTMQEQKCPL